MLNIPNNLLENIFFFKTRRNLHYNMRPKGPDAVIRGTKTPKNKVQDWILTWGAAAKVDGQTIQASLYTWVPLEKIRECRFWS
jgi:hypothetical protein